MAKHEMVRQVRYDLDGMGPAYAECSCGLIYPAEFMLSLRGYDYDGMLKRLTAHTDAA